MRQAPSTIRWPAAIGLLAAVLWVAQLAGGWQPPYRGGEFLQQKDAGLTQVIESEWDGGRRARPSEGQPDPRAVPGAIASCFARRLPYIVAAPAGASEPCSRAHALPGIRAPPQSRFSA